MTTSRRNIQLPDTLREDRPEALSLLQEIAVLDRQIKANDAAKQERSRLLTKAVREVGVSWADLARVLDTSDVSVRGHVERYERDLARKG